MSEPEQERAEKIALSKKNYEIAVAISDRIKAAGIKVDDLSVAVAGSKVYLSGLATNEDEITKAAWVASEYPGVEGGGTGIILITEEQHQEWLREQEAEE